MSDGDATTASIEDGEHAPSEEKDTTETTGDASVDESGEPSTKKVKLDVTVPEDYVSVFVL